MYLLQIHCSSAHCYPETYDLIGGNGSFNWMHCLNLVQEEALSETGLFVLVDMSDYSIKMCVSLISLFDRIILPIIGTYSLHSVLPKL